MNKLTIYSFDKEYYYFTKKNDNNIQVIGIEDGDVLKDYNALVVDRWYYMEDSITNGEKWRIQYKSRGINVKDGKEEYNFFKEDGFMVTLPKGYFANGTIRHSKFTTGYDLINILSIQNLEIKKGKMAGLKKIDFHSDGVIEIISTKSI